MKYKRIVKNAFKKNVPRESSAIKYALTEYSPDLSLLIKLQ